MEGNVSQPELDKVSHLLMRQQELGFVESYGTHVLHSTNSQFWAENLIIFGKRELNSEEVFVKVYSCAYYSEEFNWVQILSLALCSKDPHRNSFLIVVKETFEASSE